MTNNTLEYLLIDMDMIIDIIGDGFISDPEKIDTTNKDYLNKAIDDLDYIITQTTKAKQYLKARVQAKKSKEVNIKEYAPLREKELSRIEQDIVDAQLALSLIKVVEDDELLKEQEEIQTFYAERLSVTPQKTHKDICLDCNTKAEQ